MNPFLRRSGLFICSWLLGLCLLIGAGAAAFHFTLAKPTTVKTIIRDSGTYEALNNTAVSTISDQKDQVSSIPLNSPAIQAIAKQAFSTNLLQKTVEGTLDSTYKWLDGDTDTLNLSLDISASKQTFITGVGDYVQNRLTALPACTTAKQSAVNTDVFTATCVPPGVNIAAERASLESQLTSNQNVSSDLNWDQATTAQSDGSPTILGKDSPIPPRYRIAKEAYLWTLGLSVLLVGLILAMSEGLQAGVKRLYGVLFKSGVVISVVGVVSSLLVPKLVNGVDLKTSQAAEGILLPLVKNLLAAMGHIYLIFGIITLAFSGALFGYYQYRYANKA